jgi:hypothetical protein
MGGRGRKAGWRAGLQSGDGRRLWLREETTGEGTHAAVGGEGPSNLSVRGRRRSRRPGVSRQRPRDRTDARGSDSDTQRASCSRAKQSAATCGDDHARLRPIERRLGRHALRRAEKDGRGSLRSADKHDPLISTIKSRSMRVESPSFLPHRC